MDNLPGVQVLFLQSLNLSCDTEREKWKAKAQRIVDNEAEDSGLHRYGWNDDFTQCFP